MKPLPVTLLEPSHEVHHHLVQSLVSFWTQESVSSNLFQEGHLCPLNVGEERLLKLRDLGRVDLIQEAPNPAVRDLLHGRHGDILAMLE